MTHKWWYISQWSPKQNRMRIRSLREMKHDFLEIIWHREQMAEFSGKTRVEK